MDLRGRAALVTGGATGIGRATVRRLAEQGASSIAINFRTAEREAEAAAIEARKFGVDAICIRADVRRDAEVRAMVADVGKRFGRLDVLVNNAGVTHWVPLADLEALTDDIWRDVLDVNLIAAYRTVRAAASMLSATSGVVINVASVAGIVATANTSSLAYGAAKAALIYLTTGLAVAMAPRVRVNAVAPSFTDTRWTREHLGSLYDAAAARAAAATPLRRVAEPEDIAGAIVSLITGSDYVTGQTLVVDGGFTPANRFPGGF